jgi:hypothetical protein
MKDWTASMLYFVAAASRVKIPLLWWGISGTTGYNIETRLFKVSASSDRSTTGSAPGAASFGGWGRENMSLKTGDDATSTDLWTWKSTESDDRRVISALGISEYSGGEMVLKVRGVRLVRPSDDLSSTGSEKHDAACKDVQVLMQLHI